MKVAIATVQVPFIHGGAEISAGMLKRNLLERGYQADIVSIPFKWYPPATLIESMLMGRLMDLTEMNGEKIDVLIGLKFPAYYARHDAKVLWLYHQHRQAYDLWGTEFGDLDQLPEGESVRQTILENDNRLLAEAKGIFTLSKTVSNRLLRYNGLESTYLYHPPEDHLKLTCSDYEPFVFYPGRLDRMKRQRILVKAARYLKSDMRIVIAGTGSEAETRHLRQMVAESGLERTVSLLGYIPQQVKIDYYARAAAVFFGGYDEDYGFVTLEGMFASKPVIALNDSGGALEFINDGENGFVVPPDARELAAKIDQLRFEPGLPERLGQAGRQTLRRKRVDWDHVITSLLGAAVG